MLVVTGVAGPGTRSEVSNPSSTDQKGSKGSGKVAENQEKSENDGERPKRITRSFKTMPKRAKS